MKVASAESGMEKKTATVARMLPRKTRIITDVRNSPMRALVQQRLDRRLHELRLVEDDIAAPIASARRTALSTAFFDAVHHGDGVRVAALLEHRQIDRPLPIHADDVGLDLLRVLGRANIGDA